MNLYMCSYDDLDWICYVFAETRGKAKYLFNKFWNGDKDSFIDVRSAFVGKSQSIETPSVVDDENHKDYPAVLALGGWLHTRRSVRDE